MICTFLKQLDTYFITYIVPPLSKGPIPFHTSQCVAVLDQFLVKAKMASRQRFLEVITKSYLFKCCTAPVYHFNKNVDVV